MYGATLHAKKPNIKLKQVNTIDSTEKGYTVPDKH